MIICCGSGGVGKTTISAALGLALAQRSDRRVLVLTVDPARRLATALGLREIGTEPVKVSRARLRRAGVEIEGELVAAMLDMKSTFDRMVTRMAPTRRDAQRILSNRFYKGISDSFVGSHEYMAMEALYELHEAGEYDTLIIDTPPSRNALDFLEAPNRLTDFVGAKLLSWLAGPTRVRLPRRRTSPPRPFLRMADRLLGADVLSEVAEFVADLQKIYGGVQQRARAVYKLLRSPRGGLRRGDHAGARRLRRGRVLLLAAARVPHAAARGGGEPHPPGLAARPHRPRHRARPWPTTIGWRRGSPSGSATASAPDVLHAIGERWLQFHAIAERDARQLSRLERLGAVAAGAHPPVQRRGLASSRASPGSPPSSEALQDRGTRRTPLGPWSRWSPPQSPDGMRQHGWASRRRTPPRGRRRASGRRCSAPPGWWRRGSRGSAGRWLRRCGSALSSGSSSSSGTASPASLSTSARARRSSSETWSRVPWEASSSGTRSGRSRPSSETSKWAVSTLTARVASLGQQREALGHRRRQRGARSRWMLLVAVSISSAAARSAASWRRPRSRAATQAARSSSRSARTEHAAAHLGEAGAQRRGRGRGGHRALARVLGLGLEVLETGVVERLADAPTSRGRRRAPPAWSRARRRAGRGRCRPRPASCAGAARRAAAAPGRAGAGPSQPGAERRHRLGRRERGVDAGDLEHAAQPGPAPSAAARGARSPRRRGWSSVRLALLEDGILGGELVAAPLDPGGAGDGVEHRPDRLLGAARAPRGRATGSVAAHRQRGRLAGELAEPRLGASRPRAASVSMRTSSRCSSVCSARSVRQALGEALEALGVDRHPRAQPGQARAERARRRRRPAGRSPARPGWPAAPRRRRPAR